MKGVTMTGLILAAGLGTRMKSKFPKVVHSILGKPLVNWVIDAAKDSGVEKIVVVTGHGADIVESLIPGDVVTVRQEQQLGTGHAVRVAEHEIDPDDDAIVLYGDAPLISSNTLKSLVDKRRSEDYDVVVLTMFPKDPTGYGRIVKRGERIKIVEHKDASDEIREIKEVNSGIYVFRGAFLKEAVLKLKNDNKQNEYYLTDTVNMAQRATTVAVEDAAEVLGINNRVQLSEVAKLAQKRINEKHMLDGVTIVDPDTTYIGPNVKIGMDTIVEPMTMIMGTTEIGEDCLIGPMARIEDSVIESNVQVIRSEIIQSTFKKNVKVGPWSRVRMNAVANENSVIGNYVELKKTVLGKNTKAQHLSYLGDATIGDNVNIGAGTITCNYDGNKKSPTVIEDKAFIGSNSSLVAPVRIGEGSIIGAGSTITENVPPYSLGLGRSKQIVKEGKYKKTSQGGE